MNRGKRDAMSAWTARLTLAAVQDREGAFPRLVEEAQFLGDGHGSQPSTQGLLALEDLPRLEGHGVKANLAGNAAILGLRGNVACRAP
jgi:hypothetical protein